MQTLRPHLPRHLRNRASSGRDNEQNFKHDFQTELTGS